MQSPMNRSIFVLVAILLLGAVFLISPAQIPVIIFKAQPESLWQQSLDIGLITCFFLI